MARCDGRKVGELRDVKITRKFTTHAPGSVLIQTGDTHVLCTASLQEGVPDWRAGSGLGWVTAEYDMLPASTHTRRRRNRTKIDGRLQEIQRLIGRTMRSVVDMSKLGENTIILDCDVLQADGGTRTAAITGGFTALLDAVAFGAKHKLVHKKCVSAHLAAVSVGIVDGTVLLDLNYAEDAQAEVDLNLAMTESKRIIEIQGTAEKAPFTRQQLDDMLRLGSAGITRLIAIQKKALRARTRVKR